METTINKPKVKFPLLGKLLIILAICFAIAGIYDKFSKGEAAPVFTSEQIKTTLLDSANSGTWANITDEVKDPEYIYTLTIETKKRRGGTRTQEYDFYVVTIDDASFLLRSDIRDLSKLEGQFTTPDKDDNDAIDEYSKTTGKSVTSDLVFHTDDYGASSFLLFAIAFACLIIAGSRYYQAIKKAKAENNA